MITQLTVLLIPASSFIDPSAIVMGRSEYGAPFISFSLTVTSLPKYNNNNEKEFFHQTLAECLEKNIIIIYL